MSSERGTKHEVWISKAIASQTDRRQNVAQTVCPAFPRLQGPEGLGMADESEEGGIQPGLQPHDLRAERFVSPTETCIERVPGDDRGIGGGFGIGGHRRSLSDVD